MALSGKPARRFARQLRRRAAFCANWPRKRHTQAVLREVGHEFHQAVWMVTLTISQFRAELLWLRRQERSTKSAEPRQSVPRTPAKETISPQGIDNRR